MTPRISLTRRTALITALCLALAGGIGAGLVGLLVGPTVFSQIDDTRQAVRIACHQLNRAIDQSAAAAAAPDSPTALLIAEILEGMTSSERRAYAHATSQATQAGPQKNPCGRVADNAY